MLDNKKALEVKGIKYPIAFNLNVMELIQEKYANIDIWSAKLTEEQSVKDIKWSFTQMINEGIDIENEEQGTDRPFVTEKQVGRIISEIGLKEATFSLFDTVSSSVGGSEDPNEIASQNQ